MESRLDKLRVYYMSPARDYRLEASYTDSLKMGLEDLLSCDGILMLDGWGSSNGARLEHQVALTLNYPVFYEPDVREWENLQD